MTPNYFAQTLREFRELAGLTRVQLAKLAHVSPSTITRWEHGEATPQRDNAETLDTVLDADGKLRDAWRATKGTGGLPEWARDLDAIERAARHISLVSPSLVPGLLQCEDYARRVFRAGRDDRTPEELAELVGLRCGRLAELGDAEITAVFSASAVAGLPDVLRRDQAAHILKWAATGRVTVHLVPEGATLWSLPAPLMTYTLRSGQRVAASDHADGTVVLTADTHNRLGALTAAAFADALPVALSLDYLETLT